MENVDKVKPIEYDKDKIIEELQSQISYLTYENNGLRIGQEHAAKLWKQEKERADKLDEAILKIADIILKVKG